jgi:hypothetical protein
MMKSFVLMCALCGAGARAARAEVSVDAGIPAGNIVLERIDGDQIFLRQDRRDTRAWWFYWAFRVRGAAGRTLTFRFTDGAPVGTRGPAVSLDQGLNWQWLDRDFATDRFSFAFGADQGDVRFAFAMVYTQRDWERFLAPYAGSPHVRQGQLAVTRKGRAVENLRLGCLQTAPRHRVLLTARHHACEMMASYVLEGIVRGALAEDGTGRWLRRNVEFLVIPFADKDGVEDGDQGKSRAPRDHNRDYDKTSVHVETAAMREQIPLWAGDRLRVALDLHCPYIRGKHNEWVYQVGAADPRIWQEQRRFGSLLEQIRPDPLRYRQEQDLPHGVAWNTPANYQQGMSAARWAATLPGVLLAGSFEIPYATANGAAVTAETARGFGQNMAHALKRYLEQLP